MNSDRTMQYFQFKSKQHLQGLEDNFIARVDATEKAYFQTLIGGIL